jgi:hypothetical protein
MSEVFKHYSRDEVTLGGIAMSVVVIHILLFVIPR